MDRESNAVKAALQKLAARTGIQMAPNDPMRFVAARMELALTTMLSATPDHDVASTAATATHELIERLNKSARGRLSHVNRRKENS